MNIDDLKSFALDVYWSSHHNADKLWKKIDPSLWDLTHNPWVILQTISKDKLEKILAEPDCHSDFEELLKAYREKAQVIPWFKKQYPKSPLSTVAYFCMEFMLSESLPIYSGGLGNVAGDQLKAASDLGVPVVGVGLLYQQGYFRQLIDKWGNQQAFYPYNDPGQLPIKPLRRADGEWLRLEVALPGWTIWLRAWEVKVGRVKLYLLDSNDPVNYPPHRGITSELYGGGTELRLKQELVLGIGGWRLLEALHIKPEVCHLNEGHAAFAVLERARCFMKESGLPFHTALTKTRAGNLFTTHTPVPAGFDRFPPDLIEQYLGVYAEKLLSISLHDLMALGRLNPGDAKEPFNMAYLAIRGSGAVNGVSKLHGKVSRQIFEPLFPRWPQEEVPIGYVTNGVHTPSWDSSESDKVWTDTCGKQRWHSPTECLEEEIRKVSDEKLWEMRNKERNTLVEYVRKRLCNQLAARGAPLEDIEKAKHIFDPSILTLGFARRFATYKRPNLLLHNPERLFQILTNPQRPVQLILAGKAHPADEPGQALIREWMRFITGRQHHHIAFLSDYDILLTEQMVQGVDVWINTPRRPMEACGTSGMKVLVNGGINLSELDGWWAEAYSPEVGWALGDGQEHHDEAAYDAFEANELYDLLEKKVIPEFYDRNNEGIPTAWIKRMRESMAQLTPQYSSNRSVREYTEKYYLPQAAAYQERNGMEVVQWQKELADNWDKLRFGTFKVETKGDRHEFEIQVYLDGLDPKAVKVQLYAEGSLVDMKLMKTFPDLHVYQASTASSRPTNDYTPRVIPFFHGVNVPLEERQILWQK
jgi:starch phosphorylase